jgi:hypothetical protein
MNLKNHKKDIKKKKILATYYEYPSSPEREGDDQALPNQDSDQEDQDICSVQL